MRKNRLIALGIVIAIALGAGFAAWAKKDAKYIGSDKCIACHKRSHASLVTGYGKTAHASAMVDAAKTPEAIVAKFDASSPVKKEDIKYVLGLGKSYQNYLDKDLKVLPRKWDTKSRSWAAVASVDAVHSLQCSRGATEPHQRCGTVDC